MAVFPLRIQEGERFRVFQIIPSIVGFVTHHEDEIQRIMRDYRGEQLALIQSERLWVIRFPDLPLDTNWHTVVSSCVRIYPALQEQDALDCVLLTDRVLIRFCEGISPEEQKEVLQQMGLSLVHRNTPYPSRSRLVLARLIQGSVEEQIPKIQECLQQDKKHILLSSPDYIHTLLFGASA